MPLIVWDNLPPDLRDHLFERAAERASVSPHYAQDLARLMKWRRTNPRAPSGKWWKNFGSFKLCGEGSYPKTFLEPGMIAEGQELNWLHPVRNIEVGRNASHIGAASAGRNARAVGQALAQRRKLSLAPPCRV